MKRCAALLPVLLLLPSLSFATDKEVEELLAKMRDSYKAVKSAKYAVKFKTNSQFGEAEVSAEISYKSPNKIFGKATGFPQSAASEVVYRCDGKKIAIEGFSDQTIEQDFDLDNVSRGFPGNLESLCFWDYARQLSTEADGNMHTSTFKLIKDESWNDKKWTVLEETAKEQGVFCRYFIDPKTNFIWRTVVSAIDGGEQVQDATISTLEINPEIDDSIFEIG